MKPRHLTVALMLVGLILIAFIFYLRLFHDSFVQLSERPPRHSSNLKLEPITGTVGLKLQIPYSALRRALDKSTEKPHSDHGEKQTCRKILFNNVCATFLWRYNIEKSGAVTVGRHDQFVRLSVPLSLSATIGIDGKSAKLLGLSNKDVTAKLLLTADLETQMQENWCPKLKSDFNYHWLETPKLRLAGDVKLNLRKIVDKALEKNLARIESNLLDVVDCRNFRQQLEQQWKVHQFPLRLPDSSPAYLSIVPISAHISNSNALENKLTISIELNTTTQITATPKAPVALALPDLNPKRTGAGVVEISALSKIPYNTLSKLISTRLTLLQESTESRFTVKSVEVYPSGERLIFAVQIGSLVESKFTSIRGELFLSGKPVADPTNNLLKFENVEFTRVLDNSLFGIISAALHNDILEHLQKVAVFDLKPHISKLENSIVDTLSDPANTGRLQIEATDAKIRLMAINPEDDALAIVLHLSTALTGTLPVDTLVH